MVSVLTESLFEPPYTREEPSYRECRSLRQSFVYLGTPVEGDNCRALNRCSQQGGELIWHAVDRRLTSVPPL